MRSKISLPLAALLVLAAILATFTTTRYLDWRQQDKLLEAAGVIGQNFIGELDGETLRDEAIRGMVASLNDRWSYYMTAEEVQAYQAFLANTYEGLGLVVQAKADGGVEIQSVYRSSPAGEAGILPGSQILQIGGTDVTGATLEAAVLLVRQSIAAGQVQLRLLAPDGTEQAFTLRPGTVETDPVSYRMLPSGMGLIRIENFDDRSSEQALAALSALQEQGAKGLIFDVRNDPGGQLDQLLAILDALLPEGALFHSRDVEGRRSTEYSDARCVELPMAVLTNADSYSAAEFFAAALSEYDWAITVGEQTSGKGYAQITVPLRDGSAIHISSIAYYTPKGNCLAGVGLSPMLPVELPYEDWVLLSGGLLEPEADAQLLAAEEALLKQCSA